MSAIISEQLGPVRLWVDATYRTATGRTDSVMLYRSHEDQLDLLEPGLSWNPELGGAHLRLASEAYRIQLAHLFDPMLAVHTSLVEPLPHQMRSCST